MYVIYSKKPGYPAEFIGEIPEGENNALPLVFEIAPEKATNFSNREYAEEIMAEYGLKNWKIITREVLQHYVENDSLEKLPITVPSADETQISDKVLGEAFESIGRPGDNEEGYFDAYKSETPKEYPMKQLHQIMQITEKAYRYKVGAIPPVPDWYEPKKFETPAGISADEAGQYRKIRRMVQWRVDYCNMLDTVVKECDSQNDIISKALNEAKANLHAAYNLIAEMATALQAAVAVVRAAKIDENSETKIGSVLLEYSNKLNDHLPADYKIMENAAPEPDPAV